MTGRPSLYKPEFAEQAATLCKFGATDEEIADAFEVNVATIYRWRGKYQEFCEALKIGKDEADARVERSLYQKAINGDTTAMIFWLKNRRSDVWRDKTEVTHNHVHEMDDDQIRREIAQIVAGKPDEQPTSH